MISGVLVSAMVVSCGVSVSVQAEETTKPHFTHNLLRTPTMQQKPIPLLKVKMICRFFLIRQLKMR